MLKEGLPQGVVDGGLPLLLRSKTPQVGRVVSECDLAIVMRRVLPVQKTPPSLSLLYAIPDGRPPGFTIVLIRQTNPTSLRLRALNRRLITRPDTKGIGLDLDSTDERAPWKTLKRVSWWQRDKRENEKGGWMGGGNALKCQWAAAMHLCQCGIHQAQLSPRKRVGGNSRMTSSTKSQLLVMLNSFKQILQSETLS